MTARPGAVLYALSESDLRARYGRGRIRLVKWLLDPFALVGVYLILISFLITRPGPAPGLSLACAVIPFQLLMSTIVSALTAVNRRKAILLNMRFRRELIPAAAVATEVVAFGASLTLLIVMMAVYRVVPTVYALWLPVAILVTIALAFACSYPACLLGIWFPDLRNFVISFVRAFFFISPALIALNRIHGAARTLVELNPLSGIFELYRSALLYGRNPAPWQILYPLAWAVGLTIVFGLIFRVEQRQLAKVVE